jgi:hypothetical protein
MLLIAALAWPRASFAHEGVVQKVAQRIGYAAGIAVTGALRFSKKWNAPLLGKDGKPEVIHVGGHPYALKARDAPVLGPKLLSKAKSMPTATRGERFLQHIVLGLGEGAAAAPPAEARMEAKLAADSER